MGRGLRNIIAGTFLLGLTSCDSCMSRAEIDYRKNNRVISVFGVNNTGGAYGAPKISAMSGEHAVDLSQINFETRDEDMDGKLELIATYRERVYDLKYDKTTNELSLELRK